MTSPLFPNQTVNTSLVISPRGPVQKMDPLTLLQVAVKNNIDVLYFSTCVPMHMLFSENGQMGGYVCVCVGGGGGGVASSLGPAQLAVLLCYCKQYNDWHGRGTRLCGGVVQCSPKEVTRGLPSFSRYL